MLGVTAIGWVVARWFRLSGLRRLALSYPLGLAMLGLVSYGLWLADVSFEYLWTISWLAGLLALACILYLGLNSYHPQVFSSIKSQLALIREGVSKLSPIQSLLAWLAFFSLLIVLAWLWLVQPVVWDALVLYDWRAARIAEGWQLNDFLQQFMQHSEFFNYDVSHPFGSSIWQAFLQRSGTQNTGLIYSGVVLSLLGYAGIIWRRWTPWLIFVALFLVTEPMLTVMTQVYGTLPYVLYWFLFFLLAIDKGIKNEAIKTALLSLILVTTMTHRMSEPFWVIAMLWWVIVLWNNRVSFLRWSLMTVFLLAPVIAIFWQWNSLQTEALELINTDVIASRSSYDLACYADVRTIISTPIWWGQAAWLVTVLNPSSPYLLLAFSLAVISIGEKRQGRKAGWLLLSLGIIWLLMLYAAVLFEITTDPTAWQAKSRLLWRVSLPLVAWATVFSVQLVQTDWLVKSRRRPHEE